TTYKENLRKDGLAYEGMLHREVAEGMDAHRLDDIKRTSSVILFAGFNALTKAEEHIITALVQHGVAHAHWDIDAYYLNNNSHEAGFFFRQYQNHLALGKTFPSDVPSNLLG